jgi:hypothetical protein
MGETLYVLYNSPVTKIHIKYPNPNDIALYEEQQQQKQQKSTAAAAAATVETTKQKERPHKRNKGLNGTHHQYIVIPVGQRRQQQPLLSTKVVVALPKETLRQSKLIHGQDVIDVRRSHRSNKGILTQPTTVTTAKTNNSKQRKHEYMNQQTTSFKANNTKSKLKQQYKLRYN